MDNFVKDDDVLHIKLCFFKFIMGIKAIFDATFMLRSPLNVQLIQCTPIKISIYYSNIHQYLSNKYFFAWCMKLAKGFILVKRKTKFAAPNKELLLKSARLKSYLFSSTNTKATPIFKFISRSKLNYDHSEETKTLKLNRCFCYSVMRIPTNYC